MTYGIMSFFVLAIVFPAVITSSLAIVLGHIALVKIGSSQGQLLGRWQAVTGLVLGYVLLPISLYWTPAFFSTPDAAVLNLSREMALMRNAEDKIRTSSDGSFHGNSPQAEQLAQAFGERFNLLFQSYFEKVDRSGLKKKIDDTIDVYCQSSENRVCFLAKIPSYYNATHDARNRLSELAWQTGTQVASESNLPPGSQMGIGLKGRIRYGSVAIGDCDSERPRRNNENSKALEIFFK
jgi:hypothetical protein